MARWIPRVVALLWVVGVATLLGAALGQTGPLPSDDDWTDSESGRARLFDAVVGRLQEVYHDPTLVDWPAWAARHRPAVVAASRRPALDAALRRAFDDLGDDHSRWIGRTRAGEDGGSEPGLAVPGPNVDLGVDALPLDGRGLLVLRAHPGGAAERAGLQRGDVVVRAGDAALDEPGLAGSMQGRIAAALRSGPAELGVARPGQGTFPVTVEPTALPAGARDLPLVRLDDASGVARLDLPAFGAGSAEQTHAAVRDALRAGARGLVLDLRGNPGGSVLEMGLVVALAAEGDLVASWRLGGPDWRMEVTRQPGEIVARLVRVTGPLAGTDLARATLQDPARWTGPLAVLVDARTASAAEAAAAVLAREAGAFVVGRTPPGNVESVRRIAFPGGHEAWVAVGDLRWPDGSALIPVPISAQAQLEPSELARGHDAPFAQAVRLIRNLPVTPGKFF